MFIQMDDYSSGSLLPVYVPISTWKVTIWKGPTWKIAIWKISTGIKEIMSKLNQNNPLFSNLLWMLIIFSGGYVGSSYAEEMSKTETESEWEIKIGAGVGQQSSPWMGGDTYSEAIPYLEASLGHWVIGGEGLINYEVEVTDLWGLTIGIDTRDDGYQSDFGNAAFFDGYEAPDEEVIAKVGVAYSGFSIEVNQDVSNKSDSTAVSLSFELPIYETQKGFSVNLTTAVLGYSSDYVNYYYGVTDQQANNSVGRFAYQTKSAVNYGVGITAVYPFAKSWILAGSISQTKLDDNIVNSPLIDKDYQNQALLLLGYQI